MGTGRRAIALLLIVGLLGSVVVAGLASLYASEDPDGLERVAQEHEIAESGQESATGDSPLADYGFEGVEDEGVASGLSAGVGLGITFIAGVGLFMWLGRRSRGEVHADG